MRHRKFFPIATSAVVVLLAVGCSSVTPTATPWPAPAFVVGECTFRAPVRVVPMCGVVAVPQDRNVEAGVTFDLAVGRGTRR
jgi:hypothetical protein